MVFPHSLCSVLRFQEIEVSRPPQPNGKPVILMTSLPRERVQQLGQVGGWGGGAGVNRCVILGWVDVGHGSRVDRCGAAAGVWF